MSEPVGAISRERLEKFIELAQDGGEVSLWSVWVSDPPLEKCKFTKQTYIDDSDRPNGAIKNVELSLSRCKHIGLETVLGPHGYLFENYFHALAWELTTHKKELL